MDLNITPAMRGSHRVLVYIVAAGLMWVGGFVDAFGFLSLRRVYLGNMSGDTVRVGLAVALALPLAIVVAAAAVDVAHPLARRS